MREVVMPRLSESMEEGTILKWLVAEGGRVTKGEPLVEIETDKANSSYDAEDEGTLVEIVAKEGETRPVGDVIARIDEGGAGAQPRSGARGEVQTYELSRLQQSIARRTSESKATAPDYTLAVDVDMTLVVQLRERLGGAAEHPPSVDDMIVKAVANVLRDHPRLNGAYRDGKFELYSRVNVGITVDAQDAFVVPTIFDADRKSLGQIARETRELADKVRQGSVTRPELAGGTFTVASLGDHGIDEFTAVINPPQAALLAVGALAKRPAVDEHGRLVAREQVRLTLVADNRIVYAAAAARFLAAVRDLLEQPLALAL